MLCRAAGSSISEISGAMEHLQALMLVLIHGVEPRLLGWPIRLPNREEIYIDKGDSAIHVYSAANATVQFGNPTEESSSLLSFDNNRRNSLHCIEHKTHCYRHIQIGTYSTDGHPDTFSHSDTRMNTLQTYRQLFRLKELNRLSYKHVHKQTQRHTITCITSRGQMQLWYLYTCPDRQIYTYPYIQTRTQIHMQKYRDTYRHIDMQTDTYGYTYTNRNVHLHKHIQTCKSTQNHIVIIRHKHAYTYNQTEIYKSRHTCRHIGTHKTQRHW